MKWVLFLFGSLAIIFVVAALAAGSAKKDSSGAAQNESEIAIKMFDAALKEAAAEAQRQQQAAIPPPVPDPDTNAYCERVHPKSYSLQQYCRETENEARRALAASGNLPTRVLSYCRHIHPESYSLMKFCVETEMQAKANSPSTSRVVPPQAVVNNPGGMIIMRGDETTIRPGR